jgi:hypothetical protein
LALLCGCVGTPATTVERPLATSPDAPIRIRDVEVADAPGIVSPAQLREKLTGALRARIPSPGAQPHDPVLKVLITEAVVRDQVTRWFTGAASGSDHLSIRATLVDASGNPLAVYDIRHKGNPWITGAFYDRAQVLSNGIADELRAHIVRGAGS